MALRHPPKGYVPPASKGRRGARVVKYEEPPEGFWRRWRRRLIRPATVVPVIILTTFVVGVLVYYYYSFSQRIDRLLRGEVFTRSAGLYSAPKHLRQGEAISIEDLVARLKRAGYVEKTQQADNSRGRFSVQGAAVEIEPSKDSLIDERRQFPHVRVQFERGGKSVASITDLDSGGARQQGVWLEPELISSVSGSQRERRKVVGFRDLPPHLVKAITVTEDRTFFEHHGINFRGIIRAAVRRYDTDPNSPIARQGGSSITQQLVKNLFLSPEYSYRRKAAEAYMSLIVETRLTKEEIFALYCNEAYLGQRAGFSIKGFGEASEAYFNKDITALTLPEAALLAGLIRSPNRYNPYRHPEVAFERRNQVLKDMAAVGAVSEVEAARAMATELKVAPARGRIDVSEAPYFVDYAQQQLSELLADTSAADRLRIYTTIDMDLQRAAYAAVVKQLAALDRVQAKRFPPGTLQAALVALRADTGEIVAMVGGRDYEKSQLNRATDAMRQPGSVFKPFVYATALNTAYDPIPRVITAATTYMDEPKTFQAGDQEYSPGNFGEQYSRAPVTVRDALARSLNVVTVEIAQEVTIGRVMNLATKAGLPKPKRNYLAHALGTNEATPLQVASAYTAFAREGTRATPVAINRVTTGRGTTIAAPTAQKSEVMRPEIAYIMTSMMKDVVNRGTAAKVRARGLKANVAGKTGTSRDGWFAGYTPNIVCVVYVGFDDNSDLGMTGGDSALPIWTDFMTAALALHPEWGGDWQMPAEVEQVEVDTRTGLLPVSDSTSKRPELFVRGTAPTTSADPSADGELTGDELEAPTDEIPLPTPDALEVPPLPEATPQGRQRGEGEGREAPRADGSSRLSGTVTLDIDPTTNLIAAETCPVIRTRTFVIGTEPRRRCGPQYHSDQTFIPSETRPPPRTGPETRPRRVSPQ
ncbi:MAG TPA: PBP1A family penicillin-binding protein [Pyrinomonadaceae bacterium]|nr:PBP1A family penicillin-binding protein [Pyrinomonadaceae bacterium]